MNRSSKRSIVIVGFLVVTVFIVGKFFAERKNSKFLPLPAWNPRNSTIAGFTKGSTASTNKVTTTKLTPKNKCNVFNPPSVAEQFTEAKLSYTKGTAVIYVYNRNDLISREIISHSSWERGIVNLVEAGLNTDPEMGLIDVGCNLGVYTIVAAMRGRKVVAVDANINNVKRLRKSLLKNGVQDRAKVVYNGISNR